MNKKRSRTSNELEDLLRQLGLALEASGIGIWQHNISKNQTRWDEQLKTIYGVPKGPLDVVWLDSVHPGDIDETNRIFQTAIAEERDYASQFRIIRPDGAIRYLRSRARYFVDAAGDPSFVGAEWDVTDDVLRNQQLAEEREAAEESRAEARFAADHDHLTGLLNRRSFDAILAELSKKPKTAVSLCHIDIDRFKEINDRFGHAGGDIVLRHLSRILTETIGAEDIVARLGGDEFAVLLHANGQSRIESVVEAIRIALADPIIINWQPMNVQCSIGIATARSDELENLLSQSDLALYHAKKNGRNRSEVFKESLAATLAAERQTIYDLREGLALGQILPFYQTQVGAKSRTIEGIEALARWVHPTRGVLPPAAFLDIATSHGLVDLIDEAILRSVLADVEQWTKSGLKVPRVSVNISAARLSDPLLIQKLMQFDIPAGQVSFELIETIFLDSLSAQVRSNIDAIRQLGIEIEIDDLGSGHASMLGLIELRPDRVKIDRLLISPILESVTQRRLVRSLVDIARTLDIEVVAEGVETFEHADVLADLGVDFLQGYAFGRPEAASVVVERLWRNGSRSALA